MAKSLTNSFSASNLNASHLRTLKQGSKVRNSVDLQQQMPQLQKLDEKNIPILYVQTKSTQIKPITILYNHDGNESLPDIKDWLSILSEIFKANIVAWEYPGFSKGSKYSATKTAHHVRFVWKFITETLNVNPNRVILYGKGAGCGPALSLAYKLNKNVKNGIENSMNRLAGIILINIPIQGKQLDFEGIGKEQVKKITTPTIFINSTAMTNQKDVMEFYQCFAFKSGIHLINSTEIDFEEDKLEEMCIRMNKFIITLFPEYKDVFSGVELQKMKPKETYTDPIDIVRHFLKQFGLEDITENMIAYGYLSVNDLLTIEQMDIDSFGFEEEIGIKLLESITKEKEKRKKMQENKIEEETNTNTETTTSNSIDIQDIEVNQQSKTETLNITIEGMNTNEHSSLHNDIIIDDNSFNGNENNDIINNEINIDSIQRPASTHIDQIDKKDKKSEIKEKKKRSSLSKSQFSAIQMKSNESSTPPKSPTTMKSPSSKFSPLSLFSHLSSRSNSGSLSTPNTNPNNSSPSPKQTQMKSPRYAYSQDVKQISNQNEEQKSESTSRSTTKTPSSFSISGTTIKSPRSQIDKVDTPNKNETNIPSSEYRQSLPVDLNTRPSSSTSSLTTSLSPSQTPISQLNTNKSLTPNSKSIDENSPALSPSSLVSSPTDATEQKLVPKRRRGMNKAGSISTTNLSYNIKELSSPKNRQNRKAMQFNIEELKQFSDPYADGNDFSVQHSEFEIASYEESSFASMKRREKYQKSLTVAGANKSTTTIEMSNYSTFGDDPNDQIDRRMKSPSQRKIEKEKRESLSPRISYFEEENMNENESYISTDVNNLNDVNKKDKNDKENNDLPINTPVLEEK